MYRVLVHCYILLLSLSITLAWSQFMTLLREMAWSVTADLFCSVAADFLYWCFGCKPSHHVV